MNMEHSRDRKIPIMMIVLLGFFTPALFPCTLALVSGKATVDGRALMWKNRDASEVDNKMMAFAGAKYRFLGLINSADAKGDHVWGRMKTYMSVNRLRTCGGEGVLPKIYRIEDQVLSRTAVQLAAWETKKPGAAEVADFQEKTASWVYESLRAAFPDVKIK